MEAELIEPQPFPAPGDRLWTVSPGVLRGVISGGLPNKSNRRRIVQIGGHPRLIKSKEAITYEKKFEKAASASHVEGLPLFGATNLDAVKKGVPFLFLTATVYGATLMSDLDCELLPDLLQNNGFINNDKAIRRKHYEWVLDKENPRVEFEIGVLL